MIECYFSSCINHDKDEPFCKLDRCIASQTELDEYTRMRQTELDEYTRMRLEYLNRNDIEFIMGGGNA